MECKKEDPYMGFSHCFVCARKYADQQAGIALALEAQVKALTEERDAQAEAVKSACRMAYRALYLGFDRAWGESQISGIQNKIVREEMQAIARAAVEGGKRED